MIANNNVVNRSNLQDIEIAMHNRILAKSFLQNNRYIQGKRKKKCRFLCRGDGVQFTPLASTT
jgi:hypothetical protein